MLSPVLEEALPRGKATGRATGTPGVPVLSLGIRGGHLLGHGLALRRPFRLLFFLHPLLPKPPRKRKRREARTIPEGREKAMAPEGSWEVS